MVLSGTNFVGTFSTPYHEEGQTNHYTISVFDQAGNKQNAITAIVPLPTINHAPLPSIKVTPSVAGPGEDVVFDASATFDAEHSLSLLEVEWDTDGDGFFEISAATSLLFTNQYFDFGTRLVRARITDPAGAATVSAPVAVNITPCSATLSPVARTNGFGSSTNSIVVTTSPNCQWSATETADWVEIISGRDYVGTNTVRYTLQPNPSLMPRTTELIIADQVFIVTQRGISCDYVLSPSGRFHGNGAVTGTVKVTVKAECPWTVYNTNSWIRFLTPTNGFGTFTNMYVLEANRVPNERTGVVLIEDQVYTITQWGTNCTYLVSPSERVHNEGSETGLVNVAANNICAWAVDNPNDWITLSRSNGVASGTVGYTLTANFSPVTRTGVLTIAGEPVTIIQSGCTYQVSISDQLHDYEEHDGELSIVSGGGCPWTINNPNNWIHITAQTNGNGSAIISYRVDANTRYLPRAGLLEIVGHRLTITQSGTPCFYEISTNRSQHDERWDIGEIAVRTEDDCPWRVVNTNDWIEILSGTNGMGSNSVVYSVAENLGSERTGIFFIEGLRVEVYQKRGLRLAQLTDITVGSGQTSCLRVMLESHGTERSMRFSLCFDPALITFASARPFSTSRGETLSVDTSQAAQGRVGFFFSLPSGRTLFTGTQTVAEVCFRGAAIVGNRTTLMTFCDQPAPREVLNVIGQPRPVVYSNSTVRIVGSCDLAESVDAPQFVWNTDTGAAWTCQTNVTHDGQDAAQCGTTLDGSSSSMTTTINGPGTLSFWWKVSSEPGNDRLRLYLNGSEVTGYRISGNVDWEFRTFAVPTGEQDLEWRYSKNSTFTEGLDCGWVDEIRFEASPPAITSQPVSQSVDAGATVTFSVSALGTRRSVTAGSSTA